MCGDKKNFLINDAGTDYYLYAIINFHRYHRNTMWIKDFKMKSKIL